MIIAMTGGMGCGKSAARAIFEKKGFRCIDADQIVRDKLTSDPQIISGIKDHFGSDFVDSKGQVNRPKLAEVVFSDKTKLDWLEGLLHPLVQSEWNSQLESDPTADWCLEIPLLFEKKLEKQFQITVCIWCSRSTQLTRLAGRGLSKQESLSRIAKQLPLNEKVQRADYVLCNNGCLSFLESQIVYFINNV